MLSVNANIRNKASDIKPVITGVSKNKIMKVTRIFKGKDSIITFICGATLVKRPMAVEITNMVPITGMASLKAIRNIPTKALAAVFKRRADEILFQTAMGRILKERYKVWIIRCGPLIARKIRMDIRFMN
jgi:hypothetical protein